MKRKTIIYLCSGAVAFSVCLFAGWMRQPPLRATDPPTDKAETPAEPKAAPVFSWHTPSAAPTNRTEVRRTPEEAQALKNQIQDATVEYSDSTLPQFEKWLADGDAEIRAAAADGLLQSGLAGGAPLLRAAALASKNPEETAEYNRAASILELPPVSPDQFPPGGHAPARSFDMKDGIPADLRPAAPPPAEGH